MTATLTTTITAVRAPRGLEIEARSVGHVLRNGRRVLDAVSLTIRPGELVAIVGASGSGKSTLLDALAGVRPAAEGVVLYDGADSARNRDVFRSAVGYVPQDDIIHRDLPLRTTVRYAAQLRLPSATTAAEIDVIVDETLDELGLAGRGDVRVDRLSGGQRKRASIAVELLTRPSAFFLDEPTSGLDPATARGLMRTLRGLADRGATVVVTTHNTDDLRACDRVAFLTGAGELAYEGTVDSALSHFGVDDLTSIYESLSGSADGRTPRGRHVSIRRADDRAVARPPLGTMPRGSAGPLRQWQVLTRRNIDVLRSNRLTLAVMFGSPALVIAMFLVLFDAGSFDRGHPDPSAAIMTAFWTAFAGFFFGLTCGLLQVCTEISVIRRERFVGLSVRPYLLAKMAVLIPVLGAIITVMVTVLSVLGRLPALSARTTGALVVTLLLEAVAALALGLLASAAVADPSHATLALPMLSFPAVLFAGAMVPVDAMAAAGRAISVVTPNRWAFEAVGRHLDLGELATTDRGRAALAPFGDAFAGSVMARWLVLAAFAVVFLAAGARVLRRRTEPSKRR
jgi:ABC-type multidrug transport system ATPase subunit/ABC-type multidrug transport system permease subunit